MKKNILLSFCFLISKIIFKSKKINSHKSYFFIGPFQPCEIYQTQSTGPFLFCARSVITGKDIIFPQHIHPHDAIQWLNRNGYSKAIIYNNKIKSSFIF